MLFITHLLGVRDFVAFQLNMEPLLEEPPARPAGPQLRLMPPGAASAQTLWIAVSIDHAEDRLVKKVLTSFAALFQSSFPPMLTNPSFFLPHRKTITAGEQNFEVVENTQKGVRFTSTYVADISPLCGIHGAISG